MHPARNIPKVDARRHARFEVEEPALLRALGPPGGAFVITILDISKEGLRVRCSSELAQGTRVEVTCRKTIIGGEVRYTRAVDPFEFHLGIQAQSVNGKAGYIDLMFLFPAMQKRSASSGTASSS